MKALETRYAGCRFRSRLEARWAVAFDKLGLKWQYEAEGYEVTYRLDCSDETFNYLPDFWFPEQELHGEVKGSLTRAEYCRLLNAAASLSSNNSGGCHDSGGHDLVVFGVLDDECLPTRLHMHKGDLIASAWDPWTGGDAHEVFPSYKMRNGSWATEYERVACDSGEYFDPWTPERLLDGMHFHFPFHEAKHRQWSRAITAAKSERFGT